MSRNRLTTRVASDMKSKPGAQVEAKGSGVDNDSYNMNDTGHEKNDPSVSEYAKGDPSAWAEDVNKVNPAKDDQKREETGHAPLIDKHAAKEAIASARKLEEKAVKAIIASQRMLPGATDEIIEKQAGILMHLPEEGLNATLAHQEGLAQMIAKAASDSSCEKTDDEDVPADKAASDDKDEDDAPAADAPAADKAASDDKDEDDAPASKVEKLAALKKQAEALEQEIAKEAAPEEKKPEEDKPAEETVDASDSSLLDQIFSGVMPPSIKKGASKLSGMVKKEASTSGSSDLSSLWSSAPDVREVFN